ncbi:Fur-regulated basic protein FbpA [Bacillus thuringiensis]|nr:Fur-regulated basic protein FbpA [Bacillus thuringiensis]MEB4894874.1 Fur-regulated basic protein FbpA [Bacillus thuringiensis]MEC2565355.1 Fur-regulated basic protein FbpA [Bacillus thuringiensis]MEC2643817.1 Fur-regulated basic protein FbpA [Bacillus thuringiensis]MEC2727808.1 Fur-regulated basic protein FbpA [Bacillus thuringiensis]MEC2752072.1 Fur-regulated basic protein FbpA [Bacillus thuringiensis]
MERQDVLINKLIDINIYKLPDGRDLFEGSCEELAGLLERDGEHEQNV